MSRAPSDTAHLPVPPPSRGAIIGMVVAVVSGGFVAAQSRINGELGARLASGFLAALISFGTGLVIIAVVVGLVGSQRAAVGRVITAIRTGTHPWWLFCGGAFGAMFVLTQGLTAATLGVALFTVAVVAGQTVGGLLVDRVGVGSMQPRPLVWTRVIGSLVMLVAAVVAASGGFGGGVPWWLVALPLLAGLGTSFQSGINGQVREVGSMGAATLGNFVIGTAVLAVIFAVSAVASGTPLQPPPDEPWLYLGGLIGVTFIGLNAVLVRRIGVLVLNLCLIAGQLTTSVLLDVVAPVPGHALAPVTVIGTVLALVAIGITVIPVRRPARSG